MSENLIGKGISRIEGPLKVTGKARYSADYPVEKLAFAVTVGSAIASGKVLTINTSEAKKTPGVLAIITHENRPQLKHSGNFMTGASMTEPRLPLQDNVVQYAEQYIAVVVAESLEAARRAAELVKVSYDKTAPVVSIQDNKAERHSPNHNMGADVQKSRGSAEDAFAAAAVKVDNHYSTEGQNHNPMEPHATIANWEGNKLTVYDATQNPAGVRTALSQMFSIDENDVRVVSQFVGGAFGGKGNMWNHVPLVVLASKMTNRPCKIVLERKNMFTNVGRRANTKQRLAIGASKDGILQAIIHEGSSDTSLDGDFIEQFTVSTPMLYSCPNVKVAQELSRVNRILPTFMRAPGEASGLWVLESGMDELAHLLKMDPIELRMKNYASSDPESGKPFSSKNLDKCYQIGAEKIAWSKRNAQPGSRTEDGRLVGIGMATATRGVKQFESAVGAKLNADGSFVFRCSSPEQGTGSITILTQIAAESLGVPLKLVTAELGDTAFPRAPIAAGSGTVTTVGNAFWSAAKKLQNDLAAKLIENNASPFFGAPVGDVEFADGKATCSSKAGKSLSYSEALACLKMDSLQIKYDTQFHTAKLEYSSHGFGAHFAEVRVDPDLGILEISRFVSVITCGRVINERTCRSQVEGAIAWGISMAMMEATIADPRSGRIVTKSLADYHIPVNADIHNLDVHFVEDEDKHIGALGAKGVGELGIAGAPAAIANAIFNATGKRIRDLPITVEKLL